MANVRCEDCKHRKTDSGGNFLGCPMTDWVKNHATFGLSSVNLLIKPSTCGLFVATPDGKDHWRCVVNLLFNGRECFIYEKNHRYISMMANCYDALLYDKGQEVADLYCDEMNSQHGFDSKEDCVLDVIRRML